MRGIRCFGETGIVCVQGVGQCECVSEGIRGPGGCVQFVLFISFPCSADGLRATDQKIISFYLVGNETDSKLISFTASFIC